MMLFPGLMTAVPIIYLILLLSEKVEVCGNGVWKYRMAVVATVGSLRILLLGRKTKDSVVLLLIPKKASYPSDRLLVAHEDREAVHQLLAANLPDLSKEMNS